MKVKIPTQTTCKVHQDSYHSILIYISKLTKYSTPQMKQFTVLYYNFDYHIYDKLFSPYKGYYFFAEIVTE